MNVLEHCHDATASFSLFRGLVFCAKLHHGVGRELVDSTLLSLFVLPVRIRDAQFHGYQRTQLHLDFALHLSRFFRPRGLGMLPL